MSEARPLRGRVKLALIRELALDGKTEQQLGDEYGVTPQAIHEFKVRNSAAIETVRADLEAEFVALWIADKRNRIAEYETDVEQLAEEIDAAPPEHKAKLFGARHRALRAVAEELGQLAPKAINVGVHYSIRGVDMDRLR